MELGRFTSSWLVLVWNPSRKMSRKLREELERAIKSRNDAKVSELLWNQKMDVEALNKKTCGLTPLHWAASCKNNHALNLLLAKNGIDVNVIDKTGNTALSRAIQNQNIEAAIRLLDYPGIDVNAKPDGGYTPLHMACFHNGPSLVQKLLSSPGIDLNAKYQGNTPLHSACSNNNHLIIKMLLASPGVDVNAKSDYGRTPLHEVCTPSIFHGTGKERTLVLETALKLMLDDSRVNLDSIDKEGDGLEIIICEFYNSKEKEEKEHRDKCLEMIKNERLKREKRKKNKEQTGRGESIVQCIAKIEKQKRKLDEEDKKQTENLNVRKKKRENLNERQSLEMETLDKKYKEEKTTLDWKHIDEEAMLEGTFVREDKNMVRYVDSLKESMKNLNEELEKLNTSSEIDNSLNDAASGTLECPVCMELMRPPTRIWMCRHTHIICESCKDKLVGAKCPTCTTERVTLRAFVVENIARTLFN